MTRSHGKRSDIGLRRLGFECGTKSARLASYPLMLSKAWRLSIPRRSLSIGLVTMVAASLLQGCGPSPVGSCSTQPALPSSAVHTGAPPPRTYEAFAQESDGGHLILYGGESVLGPVLFDTWLWDGRT